MQANANAIQIQIEGTCEGTMRQLISLGTKGAATDAGEIQPAVW
jgi:hypothetical protein